MARIKLYASAKERQKAYRLRQAEKAKANGLVMNAPPPRKKKENSSQAKKVSEDERINGLLSFPFSCPNCDLSIFEAALFCSERCKQEAKFVRYVRNCKKDGRDRQPDIREAIQIKLASILGGGYPEKERRLPKEVREAVIDRDKGRCRQCGATGDQVDHIQGSSNDLSNLQLLCKACHNKKTIASFGLPITPFSHPDEWDKAESLYFRIESSSPIRICDSEEWDSLWRIVLVGRRQIAKGHN